MTYIGVREKSRRVVLTYIGVREEMQRAALTYIGIRDKTPRIDLTYVGVREKTRPDLYRRTWEDAAYRPGLSWRKFAIVNLFCRILIISV